MFSSRVSLSPGQGRHAVNPRAGACVTRLHPANLGKLVLGWVMNVLRFVPPMVTSDAEVDRALSIVHDAFTTVAG